MLVALVISGSWDATIKLWDVRSSQCVGTYKQPDKIFTMSGVDTKLVIGTAGTIHTINTLNNSLISGRHVHIYDLRYMDEPTQRRESSLKYQTRCIRCFVDGTGTFVFNG